MQHDRIAHALVAAAEAGDARGLARMLHPGVELTVDSGGNVSASENGRAWHCAPIHLDYLFAEAGKFP